METVKWGIVGCGDVTEVKSGPALQRASDSELVAVMRRHGELARDYARRHDVPRWYADAQQLIDDPEVSAVYVATPPSSHCQLALRVAAAGKPCLVEKPMAMDHAECERMVAAFAAAQLPLFVAYYRRALPRFVELKRLLEQGTIGTVSSVHIVHYAPLATREEASGWRYRTDMAGAGVFFDLASHGLDLIDFLLGPIAAADGHALNTGGAYEAEDVTVASFRLEAGVAGTGVWNFNADHAEDGLTLTGSSGRIHSPVFADTDICITAPGRAWTVSRPNPPHVHQPLVQTIVDELRGVDVCPSTGISAARTQRVLDRCVAEYYTERSGRR